MVMIPALGLSACGDSGTSSDTTPETATEPGPTTSSSPTETVPTTSGNSDSNSDSNSESATTQGGSMSNSAGETTTTGETTVASDTATTENVSASSTGSPSTTTTSDSDSDSSSDSDSDTTTDKPPCEPGDTQGMGDVEKSYLWVANSDQNSVSKVNTLTLVEEARYRTGPENQIQDPSRTAVSLDGRFIVVNGRQSGRTTMIAANLEDCLDNNNNGMIDTSQNPNNLLPWEQDECVRWSITHPTNGSIGGGPRGVTWTPGTFSQDSCQFENPKVWVGYLPAGFGIAHMARLNGMTGAVEETVVINNWQFGWTDYGPYGAALDKELNVWFTGLRGELFRINTANEPATLDRWWGGNGVQAYGMTVDPDGHPWMAGCSGPITTFDPETEQFITVPNTNACYRGIGADKDGHVWAASNGTCGVVQIDHQTNTVVQFHNFQPCSTPVGISTDLEGFVWMVDEWNGAWKIDVMNPNAKQFLPIPSQHYTYSDMTGGQLKSVVLPQ